MFADGNREIDKAAAVKTRVHDSAQARKDRDQKIADATKDRAIAVANAQSTWLIAQATARASAFANWATATGTDWAKYQSELAANHKDFVLAVQPARATHAIAVANAVPEAQAAAHLVTERAGGEGVAIEVCSLLLNARARSE